MVTKRIKFIAICASVLAIVLGIAGMTYSQADAAANKLPTISNTVTKGEPGVMTVENEIKTALMPIGHCLYIFGGAWNADHEEEIKIFADVGAGEEAMTIGVPQVWDDFYKSKDGTYDCWADEYTFHDDDWENVIRPQVIHWGADCSGYMGWVLQNITNKELGFGTRKGSIGTQPGWVTYAEWMGFALNHLGYGERIINPNPAAQDDNKDPYVEQVTSVKSDGTYSYVPGNIYSFGNPNEEADSENHCWFCLGQCNDGSVLLVHCSDPGVYICGTSPDPGNVETEAVKISKTYMKRYYSDFYNKFGVKVKLGGKNASGKDTGYLKYSEFNWNTSGEKCLSDDAGYRAKKPAELMNSIFVETNATADLASEGPVPTVYFNDALTDLGTASNGQIVYNRESTSDTTVDVHLVLPAGHKFDSVKINDVEATNLDPQSNRADLTVPISGDYQIKTVASEIVVNPTTETAQTLDITYIVVAMLIFTIMLSGVLLLRKE